MKLSSCLALGMMLDCSGMDLLRKWTNAVGMQRFFFQFNDIVGSKDALNIKGSHRTGITSGYMNANRITLDRPITIDYKASGDWRPRDNQTGIEINGILESRFEYSVGILNGEGKLHHSKIERMYCELPISSEEWGWMAQVRMLSLKSRQLGR